VASSMAVSATLRSGTGSRPIPTVSRLVVASMAVAVAMPLSEKQSSHTHRCVIPAASAAAATGRICSGGWSGVKMADSVTTRAPLSFRLSLLGSAVRRARLAPAAGDGQAPVPAEVLLADLRARRVLPPLVLRQVHQPDHPLDQVGVVPGRDQLGRPHVLLHVVVEQRVEYLVGRQRVGVELPRGE